jgi:signal transduction histidine kinase
MLGSGLCGARLPARLMRIVIIDDQRINLVILESTLRKAADAAEVLTFEQARAGLDYILTEGCDLILVDYTMPDMSGLDLVRAVRAQAELNDVPILMISAVGEKDIRLEALRIGANDFLSKPVDPVDLRARAESMLRLRRRALTIMDMNKAYAEARIRAEVALAELKQAQDRLVRAEKLAALGGLVAGVAHEINTPVGTALTTVTSIADRVAALRILVATNQLKKSDLQEFLETTSDLTGIAHASIERAGRIVAAFKQIAASGESDRPRRFDLGDHLTELRAAAEGAFSRGSHQLTIVCPAGLLVQTAPGALTRALTELIGNALEHAFTDGRIGTVTVTVTPEIGGGVTLEVADDGIGLSDTVKKHLYEPFFTTARHRGHIGLGLATLHNQVERVLRGTMELTGSRRGTRAVLHLPPLPVVDDLPPSAYTPSAVAPA